MRYTLALAIAIAAVLPARAQEPPARPARAAESPCPQGHPRVTITRESEHWGYLANPDCRTDAFDAVKHISVGDASFAYLGGEVRPFVESLANERFDPDADDTYLLQRFMLHGGVQIGDRSGGPDGQGLSARLFGQIKSGITEGVDRFAPPDRDTLDVLQGFAELAYAWGGAGEASPSRATIRGGRFELNYGAGRMVSVREGPNTRFGYDGGLARLELGTGPLAGWTADAFAAYPNETDPGVFDNGRADGESLWGLYATGPLAGSHALDLYYIGYGRDASPFAQGPADETRHSVGTRWSTRSPDSPWTSDLEVTLQLGSAQPVDSLGLPLGPSGDVVAWAVSSNTSYAFDLPLSPTLGLFTGFNSGDRDPADPDVETFKAPYPPGLYFGGGSPFGPSNLSGVRPAVGVSPAPWLSATVGTYLFFRTRLDDGAYNVPGIPLRTDTERDGADSRMVAVSPYVVVAATLGAHLSAQIEVNHIVPQGYIEQTGPDASITYVGVRLAGKF